MYIYIHTEKYQDASTVLFLCVYYPFVLELYIPLNSENTIFKELGLEEQSYS